MQVKVTKGTTFSIAAEGCSCDIEDLRMEVGAGQTLKIDFERSLKQRDKVYIDITMPQLSRFQLAGAADGTINGFANDDVNLHINLSGASTATLNGTTTTTQVDLSGASELMATGQTALLSGNISGGSELKAFDAAAKEVDLTASGGAKAYIKVTDILHAEASGGSKIVYRGTPSLKETSTSGGGTIVQE